MKILLNHYVININCTMNIYFYLIPIEIIREILYYLNFDDINNFTKTFIKLKVHQDRSFWVNLLKRDDMSEFISYLYYNDDYTEDYKMFNIIKSKLNVI